MRLFNGRTLSDVYKEMVETVQQHGVLVTPRGKPNFEIRPAALVTEEWGCLKKAGVNYRLACAEAMAYVCGWEDVPWLARFSENVRQFSDNASTFYGAYGARMKRQLPIAVEELRREIDGRQVVVGIWESRDLGTKTKDLPCNTQLLLKKREGKLHMMVVRRSSDLIWGVPYDHHAFWALLHVLAKAALCLPGQLVEVIDSLHVYLPSANFYPQERVAQAMRAEHTQVPHPWKVYDDLALTRATFALVRDQVEGWPAGGQVEELAGWLKKE